MPPLDTLKVVIVDAPNPGMSIAVWSLIVSAISAVGIWAYTWLNYKSVKATAINSAILARPRVVSCLDDRSEFDHVGIFISNTSPNHADIKVKINYSYGVTKQTTDQATGTLGSTFSGGPYSGKEKWDFPAFYEFHGHTDLPDLKKLVDRAKFDAKLEIHTEVSPSGENRFSHMPTMHYKWKNDENRWLPNPFQKASSSSV